MTKVQRKITELSWRVKSLELRENIPLAPFTTLLAGGPARWLAEIGDVDLMASAAAEAQNLEIPHAIIGAGSNLLPSDRGYDGLVFVNRCSRTYFGARTQYAECGCWFQDIFLRAAQRGLTGLEFAVGIPGTLGGALVSNAGAYRANIADLLTEVELVRDGARRWEKSEYLEFQYRDSILRRPSPPSIALLSVKMKLTAGEPKQIYDVARDYQRQRISKQPPHASAGSFFKNVESRSLAQSLEALPPKMKEAGVVPAGFLIESCGLKGARQGMALISSQHANFICNLGGATAADLRTLAAKVKHAVEEQYGVLLEEEVLYFGNWDDFPSVLPN
jgi:UDP-N-acetylmuramate dehydrogenase